MSFTPENANRPEGAGTGVQRNYPTPNKGPRRARVALIVDLGTQEREDIHELNGKAVPAGTEGAVVKPQKPCQQVAVFADLVNDVVDYGGDIGKAQYRLLLNNTFAGKLKGINFTASPPKDANGKTIEGKKWGFHPQNLLTKLANAVGKPEVVESMDISQLLGQQFIADVDVTTKPSGKMDGDGNEIIYKNVNFKAANKPAPVMKDTGEVDDDGNAIEIEEVPVFAALKATPLCITFPNAKAADIQFIRANLIKQIKLASNYAGSNMQKAIEEYEASKATGEAPAEGAVAPAEKPKAKPAAKPKEKAPVDTSDMDSDVPF